MKNISKESLNQLSLNDFIQLMCDELNSAGLKHREGTAYESEYTADEYTLDGEILGSVKALDYLKEIGVLNNGKCPRCGGAMPNNIYTFTSGFNPNANYAICKLCNSKGLKSQKRLRAEVMTGQNEGCYIATVCYKDYNSLEVSTLRNFRDYFLRKHYWGRIFIKCYYTISPFIANRLTNPACVDIIRKFILNPIYAKLRTKY